MSSEAISTLRLSRWVRRRAEFGGGGGFAGALQADHHDRDRRHGVEVDGLAIGAERGDQFVMNDLHHHLAGGHRLDHGGADRLLADLFGKASDHVERDVGLQQRAAHLAHRGIDVGLRQRPAPRQPIENATKLFRQIVEQFRSSRCLAPEEQAQPASRRGLAMLMPARADDASHHARRDHTPDDDIPNTFAPEGASRCRALTSGLKGRAAGRKERLSENCGR